MKLLAGLVATWLILGWTSLGLAGPRMVIQPQRLDVGELVAGETIKGVFEVTNPGDAELVIEKVAPG